jgi:dienelactone hydrolase
MLAELGYTAFALDMYGDGKQAHHPDDAGQFSSAIMKNQDLARARFNGALEVLRKEKTVDPRRIAAIGYCFGGAVVLQMARYGTDLKGVVSFHGNLAPVSPARPGAVKAKILVLTGAADSFVPPEQVEQFKKEMDAARADYRVIAYPGAKHSFTNPEADEFGKQFNLPLAYNEEADHASWKEMQEFFRTVLK